MPDKNTNLLAASYENNLEKVIRLLNNGAQPIAQCSNQVYGGMYEGYTAYHFAVLNNNHAMLEELVSKGSNLSSVPFNESCQNPLELAFDYEDKQAVGTILSLDSSLLSANLIPRNDQQWEFVLSVYDHLINCPTFLGKLIHEAIEQERRQIILQLIENGVDPLVKSDKSKKSALSKLAKKGYWSAIEKIVSRIDSNAINDNDTLMGYQLLLYYSITRNKSQLALQIIEKGININLFCQVRSLAGYRRVSLLHSAIIKQNYEIIESLISHDIVLSAKGLLTSDKNVSTAWIAIHSGTSEILKLLLVNSAALSPEDILSCVKAKKWDMLLTIATTIDGDEKYDSAFTQALIQAINHKQDELIKPLCDILTKINSPIRKNGLNVLQWAILNDNHQAIKIILDKSPSLIKNFATYNKKRYHTTLIFALENSPSDECFQLIAHSTPSIQDIYEVKITRWQRLEWLFEQENFKVCIDHNILQQMIKNKKFSMIEPAITNTPYLLRKENKAYISLAFKNSNRVALKGIAKSLINHFESTEKFDQDYVKNHLCNKNSFKLILVECIREHKDKAEILDRIFNKPNDFWHQIFHVKSVFFANKPLKLLEKMKASLEEESSVTDQNNCNTIDDITRDDINSTDYHSSQQKPEENNPAVASNNNNNNDDNSEHYPATNNNSLDLYPRLQEYSAPPKTGYTKAPNNNSHQVKQDSFSTDSKNRALDYLGQNQAEKNSNKVIGQSLLHFSVHEWKLDIESQQIKQQRDALEAFNQQHPLQVKGFDHEDDLNEKAYLVTYGG